MSIRWENDTLELGEDLVVGLLAIENLRVVLNLVSLSLDGLKRDRTEWNDSNFHIKGSFEDQWALAFLLINVNTKDESIKPNTSFLNVNLTIKRFECILLIFSYTFFIFCVEMNETIPKPYVKYKNNTTVDSNLRNNHN